MAKIINQEEISAVLEAAVAQRNSQYHQAISLTVRWEADDTQAWRDAIFFKKMIEKFQFPPPEELILPRGDRRPGLILQSKIADVFRRAKATNGRCVVLLHYAGHGQLDDSDNLVLVESGSGGKTVDSGRYFHGLADNDAYLLDDCSNVDVCYFLDCRYAHAAKRGPALAPRVVEIIAATDELGPFANQPPGRTFTAKVSGEVVFRERQGHQFVEIAELVQTLRANAETRRQQDTSPEVAKKPTHHIRLGCRSICLPFNGLRSIDPATIPPSLRAVFSIHMAENMKDNEIADLLRWIQTLPPSVSLSLDGVYKTSSTLLIFESAYHVFSKLDGLPGVSLISEATGTNRLYDLKFRSLPATAPEPKKENIPFQYE